MKDTSRCKSCGASIVWARTPSGRAIPVDPEPSRWGNLDLVDGVATVVQPLFAPDRPLYVTHFATCPNAAEHRNRRAEEPSRE